MDNRNEVRDFLASRRARITPEQAGLPAYGATGASPACAARRSPCWPGERRLLHPPGAGRRQPARPRPVLPVLDGQRLPVNLARFLFLDPRASDFYVDWDKTANDAVAILRGEADRNPSDRRLSDLVGELSTRSEEFRTRWAAHNVRLHRTGRKRLHHPVAGDLELTYEALELPALGQPGTPIPTARPSMSPRASAWPSAAAVKSSSSPGDRVFFEPGEQH